MNKTELIKQLRAATQAPMGACKDALTEAEWDLDKAIDIVKVKGLQQTSKSEGKVAAEGVVAMHSSSQSATLVEVNCQTDFVAKSPEFAEFANNLCNALLDVDLFTFDGNFENILMEWQNFGMDANSAKKYLISTTKENVVVRRWFRIEVAGDNRTVNTYMHTNSKIASAVSFEVSNPDALQSEDFQRFADNVAMQIAAMAPVAVSRERLATEDLDRQSAIFQQQVAELSKPPAAAAKILEGKMNKWAAEVCLLDQEAVFMPKTSIKQIMAMVATVTNSEIKILDFIRVQVGEGIEVQQANLVADVAQLME